MVRTFETADEFATAVGAAMRPGVADEPLLQSLAQSVEQAEGELRAVAATAGGEGLNLRLGRFFLREEDIPVIEAIGIAGTAAVALLAPGVVVAGVVVTALGSFAGLVWKAWRNGAMLSPRDIALLGLVQVHGPIGPAELLALAAKADPPFTPDAVAEAMARLGEVETRDGDIVALIREDASGRICARA